METGVRKNTLKLCFETGSKIPAHLEVLKFIVGTLKLSAADLHSVYKDENDGNFFLKFMDEVMFTAFLDDLEEHYRFQYSDGTESFVQLTAASRIFRYVRIFNLPPEIEDQAIAHALGQYGTIRQHVRERYPIDYQFSVFSGVRGVHMEVAKDIPANLYIGHFRARIYYDGLKNRCFHCKEEGHLKSSCPKLSTGSPGSGGPRTYSSVAARVNPATSPVLEVPPLRSQMQLLNKQLQQITSKPVVNNKVKDKVIPAKTEVAPQVVPPPVKEASAPVIIPEAVPVVVPTAAAAIVPAVVTTAQKDNPVASCSKSPEEILAVIQRMNAEAVEKMDTSNQKQATKRTAHSSSDGEESNPEGGYTEVIKKGRGSKKKGKSAVRAIETRASSKASV